MILLLILLHFSFFSSLLRTCVQHSHSLSNISLAFAIEVCNIKKQQSFISSIAYSFTLLNPCQFSQVLIMDAFPTSSSFGGERVCLHFACHRQHLPSVSSHTFPLSVQICCLDRWWWWWWWLKLMMKGETMCGAAPRLEPKSSSFYSHFICHLHEATMERLSMESSSCRCRSCRSVSVNWSERAFSSAQAFRLLPE